MKIHGYISRRASLQLALIWIYLLVACASPQSAPLPDSIHSTEPTLTPFQPLDMPPPGAGTAPVILPTFTPYPTQLISHEEPVPVEIVPSAGLNTIGESLQVINPLTGLPVSDSSVLQRRPMAIKVANAPDYVRPQSGLTLADVIYEYYIEWGDTRFIAVMYGNNSEQVGPVRSGRYFDEHIARMYNAFLVFKFADPRELDYLRNSTLNEFLVVPGNSACPPFEFGGYNRDSYNNFFFNTNKWADCAAKKGLDNSQPELHNGFFTDVIAEGALKVKRMYFYYSRYSFSYWEYDSTTHKYFRWQEEKDLVGKNTESYLPLTDAVTGQQVNADNVVALFVPYTFANPNEAEDEVYHIDLIDSGDAYVFRDGTSTPARWYRMDENQPLLLTTLDGSPIFLRPGRTFYEVLGVSSPYSQDGDVWHFVFRTP